MSSSLDDVAKQLARLVEINSESFKSGEQLKKLIQDLAVQKTSASFLAGRDPSSLQASAPNWNGIDLDQYLRGRQEAREERPRGISEQEYRDIQKEMREAINRSQPGLTPGTDEYDYVYQQAVHRRSLERQRKLDANVSYAEFEAKHGNFTKGWSNTKLGRAAIDSYSEYRDGQIDIPRALTNFGLASLGTLPGKLAIGGFTLARGAPAAYNRLEAGFQDQVARNRAYGNEAGYLSPTGAGAFNDIFSKRWMAYPQFALQDLFGGGAGGLFGASQAATEGARSQWRGFKRGLNPFDALSIQQAQEINAAVLQRGYRGERGMQMEDATSDLVKRLGIDAGQAISFLDLTTRRFKMDIKDAKEEMKDFGELSKASMKGLNEYMQEVQKTVSILGTQGLRSGDSAIGAGKILSSVPQISGEDLTQIMSNGTLQGLIMSDMTRSGAIRNNPALMGQLATGNIFGVNQDPYQAIISSSNAVDQLVEAFMGGKPNTSENRDTAFMMAGNVLGIDPEKVRNLYNNKGRLKSEARAGQSMDRLSKEFEGFNRRQFKKNMKSEWEGVSSSILTERGLIGTQGKVRAQGSVPYYKEGTLDADVGKIERQLNIDWEAFLGNDYSSDRKNKILNALVRGGSISDDPVAQEALNELQTSLSTQDEYTNLMTYYGKDPNKLEDMSKGSWNEFINQNPEKLGGIRKNLETVLKSAGQTDPQYRRNASNRQMINDVLEGKTTIKEFQDKVQSDVNKARARAEGREVLVSLSGDAAKYLSLTLGKDHSRPASSSGSGFSNRNDEVSVPMGVLPYQNNRDR